MNQVEHNISVVSCQEKGFQRYFIHELMQDKAQHIYFIVCLGCKVYTKKTDRF